MNPSPVARPDLQRSTLLRAFKLRMLRTGADNHTPFVDRVATAYGTDADGGGDLEDLHGEVRELIAGQIKAVRQTQRSQVVLLSGAAGAGKSHLLRYFARPEVAERCGHLFVGGSNHWRLSEFQPYLLDRIIAALTSPAPSEPHVLLERIRDIGFHAVELLLNDRTALKRCLARRRRSLWSPFGRRKESYETVEQLAKSRDPAVFDKLDFTKFSEEVCYRFLAEASNPVHRYAMRVLLTYLFPDPAEVGLGTRDRVLNWFRRTEDDRYWTNRLGVGADLTHQYAVADAIKLLVHLFNPELSRQLSTNGTECRPLVFLLAFDQTEGRDELFDSDSDWNDFFAHLSELYNTLPNTLIVFTMTLGLRNELHPRMERQFKDRIRQDERFVLRQPDAATVRSLYRRRMEAWLADEPELQRQYRLLPEVDQYLPFSATEVEGIGLKQSVRDTLAGFDQRFFAALRDLVIEPNYDFEYVRNQHLELLQQQSEWESAAGHLELVRSILSTLTAPFFSELGVTLDLQIDEEDSDGVRALELRFSDPEHPSSWVCVYLASLGFQYRAPVQKCSDLLKSKQRDRYSVWMVRARTTGVAFERPAQMFEGAIPSETAAQLVAVQHLLSKQVEYTQTKTWPNAWEIISQTVRETYLGKLLLHARERVDAKRTAAKTTDTSAQ